MLWDKNYFRSSKGSTLILVAAALLILFGCTAVAVDAGYMYSEKAKMSAAADAAALAGAYKFSEGETAVRDRAIEIAKANGVDENKVVVTIDTSNKKVKVEVEENVNLFFARALGRNNTNIGASAVAQESPPIGVRGLIPIGVTRGDWETAKDPITGNLDESVQFEIKLDSHSNNANAGNFHAVDFPEGSGGSGYNEFLSNGYDGYIYLGQNFDTETGVMAGPTKDGFDTRVGACTCTDPHNCNTTTCPVCSSIPVDDRDGLHCARLGIIPLINTFEINGKKQVTVLGFAAIFISELQGSKIYASYVNDIITPEGRILVGGENAGVTTVRLVE